MMMMMMMIYFWCLVWRLSQYKKQASIEKEKLERQIQKMLSENDTKKEAEARRIDRVEKETKTKTDEYYRNLMEQREVMQLCFSMKC